ncbi:Zinc finger, RING-type, partial [Dillenia turbinata]
MGLPETPSPPHLYPQALQLKLYQAFIFSIPILFSIILFLLFYLFYLKRRASTLSSPSPLVLPTRLNHATSFPSMSGEISLKGGLKEKLPVILFEGELKARDSQCCVCLGEFELKEELNQVPTCKHVFHIECISHWLYSNSTCPLCRCSVVPTTGTKVSNPEPPVVIESISNHDNSSSQDHYQQQQSAVDVSSNGTSTVRDEYVICIEGSSAAATC